MERRELRGHIVLSLTFIMTRAALQVAGVEFNFSLDWMWLSDPADLRDRLLETIYYFHAFPPGMNLATGILLKVGGPQASTLALLAFGALGLILVNSILFLARAAGMSRVQALAVAGVFSVLPQAIYFERLYLYEEPVAALLCLAAALFYAAVRRQSVWAWGAFFLICSVIGVIRSTFHLVWFVGMVGFGLLFTGRPGRRRVLAAACVPAALLLSLYLKNFAVFGTFDAFTYGPSSYTLATLSHLPDDVRDRWIDEGKLSRFAAVSVYAGPEAYEGFFETSEHEEWPRQMTQLERPSVHAPNFNHWWILEGNRERRADALSYLRTYPFEYATYASRGLVDLFRPSTEWHPYDATDRSPHDQHRQVLGRYEALYNRVVHGVPLPPVGLYVFLPLVMLWTLGHARTLVRTTKGDELARGAMLYFCVLQIAFVVAASSAFTYLESARYRYQVESMIWVITALCLVTVSRAVADRLRHP